jgi:hypothetical protein
MTHGKDEKSFNTTNPRQPARGTKGKRMSEKESQKAHKQLEQEYQVLSIRYKRLQEQNTHLRDELEEFTQELNQRDRAITRLKECVADWSSLLQQIQREELRLPSLHPRVSTTRRIFQQQCQSEESLPSLAEPDMSEQDMLPLNVWLVTTDRFLKQVIGHYVREHDRVLIIEKYEFLKQLVSIGLLPDIIITGTYDLGIDDPSHTTFFRFLERMFEDIQDDLLPQEFFVLTLTSTVPEQSTMTATLNEHQIRHEFVSKLRGLQITLSEVRFFLEMRRCRPDIMKAETSMNIHSMGEVTRKVMELQQQQKTGGLIVLSEDSSAGVRWVFYLFFLEGKLVKTEHTLESSITLPPQVEDEFGEQIFTLPSFDSQHKLSGPEQLYFFPLSSFTVLREMQRDSPSSLSDG